MTFNKMMHPRNPYKDHRPDFAELAIRYEQFRQHCSTGNDGKVHLDFHNAAAVNSLAVCLLKEDFGLDVELPDNCLAPRLPQRLNYILWLEDLIELNGIAPPITAIDIGTGASCIYALLGARKCGWQFVGTDKDQLAVNVALRNVHRNGLESSITILKVDEDTAIDGVRRVFGQRKFTFTMCNPPFFEYDEQIRKFTADDNQSDDGSLINNCNNDNSKRHAPHSTTVARLNEVCSHGGEVTFVGRLIDDSMLARDDIKIYTSMIGKKSSLQPLKNKLRTIAGVHYSVTTFCQGKTQRWALAWTYCDDIRLDAVDMCKLAKVTIPVYDIELPIDRRTCSVDEQFNFFKDLMLSLQISCIVVPDDDGESHSTALRQMICHAYTNTWIHQRRKRRAAATTTTTMAPFKRQRRDNIQTKSTPIDMMYDASVHVQLGVGDGSDSLADAGNCNNCAHDDDNTIGIQTCMMMVDMKPKPILVNFRVELHRKLDDILIIRLIWNGGSRDALNQIAQFCRNAWRC